MTEEKSALPIAPFEDLIVKTVGDHRVTIITAETGAGKSTQVPQYLRRAGYQVVVTEPRRLAARTVAMRVAEEMWSEVGETVGYATGFERVFCAETSILFVTDGLQLVRELFGQYAVKGDTVLVLDEIHEWNIDMEMLVAWVKRRLDQGDDIRLVLMSATMDAQKLSAYFGGAPIIEVPGRSHPVDHIRLESDDLLGPIRELTRKGRNVLVFVAGMQEINRLLRELANEPVVALPLHGEMRPEDQAKCFLRYPLPKVVVATNVAQTSVTIDDIDAVVDSGLERQPRFTDGVEGLFFLPISQSDCLQRAGRAGRVRRGIYYLCSPIPFSDRPEYKPPHIHQLPLDQMVLRIAVQGLDATALTFYHPPNPEHIRRAKNKLVALGAMNKQGVATEIGRQMSRLPVSVHYARMIIEAEGRDVVDDIVTIASILEAKGIRERTSAEWRYRTQESKSDLLAELDLWRTAKSAADRTQELREKDLEEIGIRPSRYWQAELIRKKILRALAERGVKPDSTGIRTDILKCLIAGLTPHVYFCQEGRYFNGDGVPRELERATVVPNGTPWVVGIPTDIQKRGQNKTDGKVIRLLTFVSELNPAWLVELAPHLLTHKTEQHLRVSEEHGCLVSTTEYWLMGQKIAEETCVHHDRRVSTEAAILTPEKLTELFGGNARVRN